MLFRNLERFLAGGKEAHLRRGGAHRFDELGDEMDQMLAIVEHQQQSLRREQRRNAGRGRLVAGELQAQHVGHGRRHESAVAQCGQFDPPDAIGKVGGRFNGIIRRHLLRDARLADASRADNRYDDVLPQQRFDRRQIPRAPIQRQRLRGQIRAHACRCRRRG